MFSFLKVIFSSILVYLLYRYGILNFSLISIKDYNVFTLSLIILLIFLTIFLSSLRFFFILKFFNLNINLKYIFSITYIGYFFNQCLPGGQGGDIFKAVYLIKKYPDYKKLKIFSYLVIDRLIGLISLLIIFSISIYSLNIFFSDLISLGLILLFFTLVIIITLFIFFKIKKIIFKILSFFYLNKIKIFIEKIIIFFNKKNIPTIGLSLLIIVSLITFIISIICIILLDNSEYFSSNKVIKIYFISSVTFLSNSIPISFNGLGVGEYIFSKLSNYLLNGDMTYYANLFLIYRILLIITSLPGFILFLFFKNVKNVKNIYK